MFCFFYFLVERLEKHCVVEVVDFEQKRSPPERGCTTSDLTRLWTEKGEVAEVIENEILGRDKINLLVVIKVDFCGGLLRGVNSDQLGTDHL